MSDSIVNTAAGTCWLHGSIPHVKASYCRNWEPLPLDVHYEMPPPGFEWMETDDGVRITWEQMNEQERGAAWMELEDRWKRVIGGS